MLPMWSPSSWERNTQRTSAGSTIDDTASSHCSRCSGAPVSTTTGCSARITSEFTNTNVPGSAGTRLGIRYVSGAMRCGSATGVWDMTAPLRRRIGDAQLRQNALDHPLQPRGRLRHARLASGIRWSDAGRGARAAGSHHRGRGAGRRGRTPAARPAGPRSWRRTAGRSAPARSSRRCGATVRRGRRPARCRATSRACAEHSTVGRRCSTTMPAIASTCRATPSTSTGSRSSPPRATASSSPERPAAARETLADALALWRGPALVELVDQGVNLAQAAALEERRLAVAGGAHRRRPRPRPSPPSRRGVAAARRRPSAPRGPARQAGPRPVPSGSPGRRAARARRRPHAAA